MSNVDCGIDKRGSDKCGVVRCGIVNCEIYKSGSYKALIKQSVHKYFKRNSIGPRFLARYWTQLGAAPPNHLRCSIGGAARHLTRVFLELGGATHHLTTVRISIPATVGKNFWKARMMSNMILFQWE